MKRDVRFYQCWIKPSGFLLAYFILLNTSNQTKIMKKIGMFSNFRLSMHGKILMCFFICPFHQNISIWAVKALIKGSIWSSPTRWRFPGSRIWRRNTTLMFKIKKNQFYLCPKVCHLSKRGECKKGKSACSFFVHTFLSEENQSMAAKSYIPASGLTY